MFNKTTLALVLTILVGSSATGLADVRHAARHAHRGYARIVVHAAEPARIIEVRPGLWVGSYQCVTDLERGGRDCSSSP
jgi:hypothetical protein